MLLSFVPAPLFGISRLAFVQALLIASGCAVYEETRRQSVESECLAQSITYRVGTVFRYFMVCCIR